MKIVVFNDFKVGVVRASSVVDITDVISDIPHIRPDQLVNGLIEHFDQYKGKIEQKVASSQGVPLNSVLLRSPLPKPPKLVCMAVNYMEDGTRSEPAPINAFLKSPTSVIGDGDTVELTVDNPTVVENEAELGLVIGKRASKVKAENWREYVFGYVNFIDVSSRGLGAPGMDNFFPTKSQYTSAPIGPWLVTADEIPDPQNIQVRFWVNGDLKQNYNTNDMGHKIPRVVEWTSYITTLLPGDVIAAGTNHWGLGPLHDGDFIEMETEGLGRLRLKVKDIRQRQWVRETHRERQAKGLPAQAPRIQ
ncbi:MAG: fumarylacetoacetate hydrolase family protein [Chloroflexi bacterium]|nr:fumarylacetoacetate hydrolase family protein [Chloroflexota bacterium]